MPPCEVFCDAQGRCDAHGSEALDTQHPLRPDRSFEQQRYGGDHSAKDELVTGLRAAFPCADLELKVEDRQDHAAYFGPLLQVLSERQARSSPRPRMRSALSITCMLQASKTGRPLRGAFLL